MHWEPCEVCNKDIIIFDLEPTATGYRHKDKYKDDCQPLATQFTLSPQRVEQLSKHVLQQQFGFDKPEDGSERRFTSSVKQTAVVPWIKFRMWWLIHNAVAHPLIAVAPRKTFFKFHDYTSRRMHGRK